MIRAVGLHLITGHLVRALEAGRHIAIGLTEAGYDVPVLICAPGTTEADFDLAVELGKTKCVLVCVGPGSPFASYRLMPKADVILAVGADGRVSISKGGPCRVSWLHYSGIKIEPRVVEAAP